MDNARVDYGGGPPHVVRAVAVASSERRDLAHKTKENMLRLELACRGLLLPDDFFEDGRFDLLDRGDEIRSALLEYAARGDDDSDEEYDTDTKDEDDDKKKDDEEDEDDDGIDDE
jgi:hypothetical protein